MKKVIAVVAALAWLISPANADVYVKVDANGNALGGGIICEPDVCGNPESTLSKITLKDGERYVLQSTGDSGSSADSNAKYNAETNVWTVNDRQYAETLENPLADYSVPVYIPNTFVETSATVITETATVVSDTATVVIETTTATSASTTLESLYAQVMALLTQILALIAKLNG
jgi:hypothetical protein